MPRRFTQLCLNNDELVMDMGAVLDGGGRGAGRALIDEPAPLGRNRRAVPDDRRGNRAKAKTGADASNA